MVWTGGALMAFNESSMAVSSARQPLLKDCSKEDLSETQSVGKSESPAETHFQCGVLG